MLERERPLLFYMEDEVLLKSFWVYFGRKKAPAEAF